MKDVEISFIIPAYNAANILQASVKSIIPLAKKRSIEILIIENGSTDDTTAVACRLEQEYDFVHVYHSKKGVSAARNLGMSKASGRWLAFVDADDRIYADAFDKAIEENEEGELVICGYTKGDTTIDTVNDRSRLAKASVDEIRAELISNPTRFMAVWGKLIKRELVSDGDILFNEALTMAEDSDFMISLTGKCGSIVFDKNVVYDYSLSQGSTVRTYDNSKVKKYITSMECTAQKMKKEPDIVKKAFDRYVLMHLNISMVHETFSPDNKETFARKVSALKKTVSNDIYAKALVRTKISQCKSARMVPILLLKLHMNALAGLIYALRAKQNAGRK